MMPPVISTAGKEGQQDDASGEDGVAFMRRGYRVGTLKHDCHGVEIDREGTESDTHFHADAAGPADLVEQMFLKSLKEA